MRKPHPLILSALLLSGCATNALRIEYAETVGAKGEKAAAASRAFVARAAAAREDTNIELVAADPACGDPPIVLRRPPKIGPDAPARGAICLLPKEKRGQAALDLRTPVDDIEAALALTKALVDYTDALAAIAGEEAEDPTKSIDNALTTAGAFDDAFAAISGGAPVIPGANDARVKAIKGFVQFVYELSREADQVKRLRAVVADHPDGAQPFIAALEETMRGWEASRTADRLLMLGLTGSIERNLISRRIPASPGERREALRRVYEIRAVAANEDELFPALEALYAALAKADNDFRRVIVKNPDLNDKERRRIAEITRIRVIRALDTFTALLTSFKGV